MINKDEILNKVNKLVSAYQKGLLGGEKMPEDENPCLEKGTNLKPIDIHTPMWLWSRGKFKVDIS